MRTSPASASSPSSRASASAHVGVSSRLVEPLERSQKRARGNAFVGDGEDLAVVLGLVDDLEEELDGLVWRLVRCGCVRARTSAVARRGARRQRGGDHRSELCLGATRVARLEVEVRGVDGPPHRVVRTVGGRQLAGTVEEERRRSRRTTRARMPRGLLESRRDCLVGLVDRRGELPGSRLGIVEQLGEARVDLCTTLRICRLEGACGEQRVREADPIALGLDDASLESRDEAGGSPTRRMPSR